MAGMTKEELNAVNVITKAIRKEQERLANLTDWMTRITAELDGLPHEASYQRSKIEELTIQKVECENKLNELRAERANETANLIKKIDDVLTDNIQNAVVVERYGFGQCFKKIAEKMHMTERNVFIQHRKGLRILFNEF